MFPESADVLFVDRDDNRILVTVSLRVIEGRPVLVGAAIGPIHPRVARELKAAEVRLPIEELTDLAVRAVAASFADERAGPGRGNPVAQAEAAVRARQRHAMTDSLLREVAEVVKSDTRGEPRQAVKNHFPTSLRTASRWIAAAKAQGFLTTDDNEED